MAKQRYINTKFWSDTYISDLDPTEKLLFLYLLTNERTNIAGIYELPLKYMAIETGIDKEMVEKILLRFEKDNRIFYLNGWICVFNFVKHQDAKNPKIQKGISLILDELPNEIEDKINSLTIPYLYPMYSQSHSNPNNNNNSNNNNNTNSNKKNTNKKKIIKNYNKEDTELAVLLWDLISERLPTHKQPNLDEWANQIRLMRKQDKRTPEQIKFLIEWTQQDNFWQGIILSTQNLRKHFDKLVAQVKRDKDKNSIPIAK